MTGGGKQKGLIDVKIRYALNPNRYDAAEDTLPLTAAQIEGLQKISQHREKTFKDESALLFLGALYRIIEQKFIHLINATKVI
jgi:hypothetical protein